MRNPLVIRLEARITEIEAFHDRACMEHEVLSTSHHPDCRVRDVGEALKEALRALEAKK